MSDKTIKRPAPDLSGVRLPKLCGADIELGNFVTGSTGAGYWATSGGQAASLLLAEIDGLPRANRYKAPDYAKKNKNFWTKSQDTKKLGRAKSTKPKKALVDLTETYTAYSGGYGANYQDYGRKYLPTNGGCIYIDMSHLELCLPEVVSAFDHVAAWHGMLRITRDAMNAANSKLPVGKNVEVLVNNSDGQGNSYGSHLNFLLTRQCWDNLFNKKIQQLLYLAAYQVSSVVFTGAGKVGAENHQESVNYQISQRADFFQKLVSIQTTHDRPIVNSRDEAHCGSVMRYNLSYSSSSYGGYSSYGGNYGSSQPKKNYYEDDADSGMARLHCIFFDNTLAQGSCLLKVGVMQLILAMIEAEYMNFSVLLDNPVDAVVKISHDPELNQTVKMADGRELTAVEIQRFFLEDAKTFQAAGGFDQIVDRSEEIIALWGDTLDKLEAKDFDSLAPRLDWVLKKLTLESVLEERPDLTWASPEIKHLDQMYSNLDPEQGLYWSYEDAGNVEKFVEDSRIDYFTKEPPENSRAYTRAQLLRRVEPDVISDVNWDSISFKIDGVGYWGSEKLRMDDPLELTKDQVEPLFNQTLGLKETLELIRNLAGIDPLLDEPVFDGEELTDNDIFARKQSEGNFDELEDLLATSEEELLIEPYDKSDELTTQSDDGVDEYIEANEAALRELENDERIALKESNSKTYFVKGKGGIN